MKLREKEALDPRILGLRKEAVTLGLTKTHDNGWREGLGFDRLTTAIDAYGRMEAQTLKLPKGRGGRP